MPACREKSTGFGEANDSEGSINITVGRANTQIFFFIADYKYF
ncbi:hypothetical protein APHCRT_1396 [Anaplasma phagocytophilum str. CRT53-1]|uniref:Uncharacterized protein n=1 Tax=Anaplasma phagocytophilum str. CRT53-1 TaxID=1359157 RepID=A0A0F3PS89_ANAPH|nr:hypothetical protein APHCRT_1396 [Anaplasma phagocytophilum str. CRT53-1]